MSDAHQAPTFGKLLGALIYDVLVLSGLLLGILVLAIVILTTLDLPQKELPPLFGQLLWLILLGSGVGYFVYSWTRGGQTLGLRAWRLRLVGNDGTPVGAGQSLKRAGFALLSLACAGLGFLWLFSNRERRTWHDLLAGTKLIIADN